MKLACVGQPFRDLTEASKRIHFLDFLCVVFNQQNDNLKNFTSDVTKSKTSIN